MVLVAYVSAIDSAKASFDNQDLDLCRVFIEFMGLSDGFKQCSAPFLDDAEAIRRHAEQLKAMPRLSSCRDLLTIRSVEAD
jgi:hypothetical protein